MQKGGAAMSEQDIRLVVTDLDDTLLDPTKEISAEAVEKIESLQSLGIHFTFITGRPPHAVERFARKVKPTVPMVCCNGAMLVDKGQILAQDSFPLAPLHTILEQMASLEMTVLLFDGETEYILKETAWSKKRSDVPLWPGEPGLWRSGQAVKIAVMAGNRSEDFKLFIPALQSLTGEYSLSLYGEKGCEIVARGVNKAVGLQKLVSLLNMGEADVMAIGDNENDLEMLKTAGIGVAVANAVDSSKAAADYVCRESYTNGVVEALDRFVFKGSIPVMIKNEL